MARKPLKDQFLKAKVAKDTGQAIAPENKPNISANPITEQFGAYEINTLNSVSEAIMNDDVNPNDADSGLDLQNNGAIIDETECKRRINYFAKANGFEAAYNLIPNPPSVSITQYTIQATNIAQFLARNGKLSAIQGYIIKISNTNPTSDVRIAFADMYSGTKKLYQRNGDLFPANTIKAYSLLTIFYNETLDGGNGGFEGTVQNSLPNGNPLDFISVATGDYKQSAISVDHNGWLLCNGQAVSRTTYADLFTLIGTAFGVGDGSTTFNLPDFRGRVFGMMGQGVSLTNRTLGSVIGAETHTLTENQIPSHRHQLGDLQGASGSGGYNARWLGREAENNLGVPYSDYTGGGEAHNNMQPTLFAGNAFIFSGVI